LVSCGQDQEPVISSGKPAEKEYNLSIFNSNPDIEEAFQKMCDDYYSRTGIMIKAITFDPNIEENADLLEKYMETANRPTIFMINSMEELNHWHEKGCVLDFSNASETDFKDLANSIPPHLRLSSNTVDSFGIPCTIEGFGFLIDPKMLSSLFGGDKYRAVITDLKACTYDEFASFVNAVKLYITNENVFTFNLNGNPYQLLSKKSGLSENLKGVFSFSADNLQNIGGYLLNPALSAIFSTSGEANCAVADQIDLLMDPFMRYAEMLDLVTSSVAGKDTGLIRGEDLLDKTKNNSTQTIKNFASGKSLMMLATNTMYDKIALYNSSMANRSIFIPIKTPILEQDITAKNITDKKINSSITVFVPSHYVINAKASEQEQIEAQKFLVWLCKSELAYKYVAQEFRYIPFDTTEPDSTIDNSLSKSMIDYFSAAHVLPGAFRGTPKGWIEDKFAKYIVDNYLSLSEWSYNDYQKIADYGIKSWKEK
jgi:raffinose/stachyose/melibiose transport system substrate-binding protein